jgi:serine/threonine protein kinase
MKQAESGIPHGTVIDGKYRVEDVVGRGGMGTVYRAQHMALHEPVAIKILRRDAAADEEIVTRFLREGQLAVKLRSEHVARIHDISRTDDGLPYMVMELLQGADLGQLVEQYGAMAAPIAVDLLLQSCDAIVEAHSLGIVHRDIKPTNLFVSFRPDQTAIVKVLDFGISKAAGGTDMSLTQTQSMLGTPAYMSPEQMRSARDVDQRTDVWSLGTVLY